MPTTELLWPEYATPADLAVIESVPLQARGLPETTYALLAPRGDAVARPGRGVRPARRASAGSSLPGGPTRSCSPTSTATRTCCTSWACGAPTRSR